ncbi:hypothetical protein BKA70DRAFT_542549 [Coprinopsis sp. MPI-PUGE-AT-0042]|nr:hypothetical protein BKA70DRAFT_542549 [Coprinopsis sp. MPI-PUGE-AT-0042]
MAIRRGCRRNVAHSLARHRANHYLPTQNMSSPPPRSKIKHGLRHISTRHIRSYLGLDTKATRVPSALVMKKLQELDSLDAGDFQRFIWQIIRCIYLLWQIGIAHGDISFWNMMFDISDDTTEAVLIDYDYATIMEPGTRSPTDQALRTSGLDLLWRATWASTLRAHH